MSVVAWMLWADPEGLVSGVRKRAKPVLGPPHIVAVLAEKLRKRHRMLVHFANVKLIIDNAGALGPQTSQEGAVHVWRRGQ